LSVLVITNNPTLIDLLQDARTLSGSVIQFLDATDLEGPSTPIERIFIGEPVILDSLHVAISDDLHAKRPIKQAVTDRRDIRRKKLRRESRPRSYGIQSH
jgi:hypothetical protein